ncbi:histone H2A deubiquitinase MYSM1 [Diretmus argenteus]
MADEVDVDIEGDEFDTNVGPIMKGCLLGMYVVLLMVTGLLCMYVVLVMVTGLFCMYVVLVMVTGLLGMYVVLVMVTGLLCMYVVLVMVTGLLGMYVVLLMVTGLLGMYVVLVMVTGLLGMYVVLVMVTGLLGMYVVLVMVTGLLCMYVVLLMVTGLLCMYVVLLMVTGLLCMYVVLVMVTGLLCMYVVLVMVTGLLGMYVVLVMVTGLLGMYVVLVMVTGLLCMYVVLLMVTGLLCMYVVLVMVTGLLCMYVVLLMVTGLLCMYVVLVMVTGLLCMYVVLLMVTGLLGMYVVLVMVTGLLGMYVLVMVTGLLCMYVVLLMVTGLLGMYVVLVMVTGLLGMYVVLVLVTGLLGMYVVLVMVTGLLGMYVVLLMVTGLLGMYVVLVMVTGLRVGDRSTRDLEGGGLVQDQFLSSAWKTNSGILPWELDSSISAENRAVIENMLLEEQYYLTGKDIPNNAWCSDSNTKPKVKKSPAKASSSGSSSRWSQQEKEMFEEGLAQFGRRWTKIAKLLGSRTVLQVKSYAKQYFKHKAKSEPRAAAPSAGPVVHVHAPQSTSSHASASTLGNAVRIEKLSDDEDEEVDITDDLSDDGEVGDKLQAVLKTEPCWSGHLAGPETQTDNPRQGQNTQAEPIQKEDNPVAVESSDGNEPSHSSPSRQPPSPLRCSEEPGLDEEDGKEISLLPKKTQAGPGTESKKTTDQHHMPQSQSSQSESSVERRQLEDACGYTADDVDNMANQSPKYRPEEDQEGEEEEEEEEELKTPEQEIEMDMETITEDEKHAIPEFFEGRPSKTPERYLKIRNYILDQWLKSKPKYLNKTSVRPGLKNCGDVNCIGRVHTYLELIGAINFNCEQAVYNRPKVLDRSKHKEGKDALEAYQLAQRLQSMRTRKRRVRDIWGNWRDARDLEGQTYEHLSAEELALRREEMKKQPKPAKMSRTRGSFDPFQLIPCRSFGEEVPEPFRVIVCAEALLIMDMHAHVSRGEVIGLLGGAFSEGDKVLKICAAEPCNSVSTGLQCEMDPVSQTQACEMLSSLGFSVVGWYHSHPTFHPNPSLRDIHTQDQFQSYFSRGGAPFIGMIVSPYDPANPSPHSQTTCLLVRENQEHLGPQKMPYRFDFLSSQDIPDWEQMLRRAQWIIGKYSQTHGSVQMDRFFRRDSHLTCLEKMLSSLARYLEPLPDEEGDPFLTQIQTLFQSEFIAKQPADQEGEALNISSRPIDSDGFAFDQPISSENTQEGNSDRGSSLAPDWDMQPITQTTNSDMDTSPVLHLGSVLLTGHDYLL